ncbi:MAG: carboxy terminal-processing peptidase [Bacteriovoracaceae bacterium]|jgi:carboxyl-terminal processing protease|nr:carboxy terminal-processing peptidase [Bacteriovoracaceae bacterium]
MKKKLLLLITLVVSLSASAQQQQGSISKKKDNSIIGSLISSKPSFTKEQVLGSILKGALENMHFMKKKVDDNFSKKAFDVYLERIDYGKQFLLMDDVYHLQKYSSQMDDELSNGRLAIVDETKRIFTKRIPIIQKHVNKILSKPIDFKISESFETDPEKRDFVRSIHSLKERWRKMVKLDTLSQILELKEEQEPKKEEKKKKALKKKKPVKKLTFKQMEQKARQKVQKRFSKVFKRLLEEKRNNRLDKFYNSLAKVFDPHTQYLIPEEKEDFDIDMSGKLEGIGASLREEGSYIKVEKIIPGSASWKGKELKAEDIILAVAQAKGDPVSIVDMSIRDAVKLIRGKKGTVVKLTVKKPDGSTKVIEIIRDEVVIEESYVKHSVIENKKLGVKVGYINVPKFYRDFSDPKGRNCSTDVKNSILALKKEKVQGIILDLRNNGGGALQDANLMGGLFIKKGPIVQVKDSVNRTDILADTDGKIYFKKPLIVLVNRFSASASEIVAAAMQDYERAIIVGTSEQTHGKGTVQAVLNLDGYASPGAKFYAPYGALKLTIQMFYRINGASTQFNGVAPDIVLPGPLEYIDSGERTLDYAIPYQELKELDYKKWSDYAYNMKEIKSKSAKRVASSPQFKIIKDSVAWFKKRKDQSVRSLSFKEMVDYREEAKKMSEKFKLEHTYDNVLVHHTNKKVRDEVEKEKRKEFVDSLKKDPVIDEVLHMFKDIKLSKK